MNIETRLQNVFRETFDLPGLEITREMTADDLEDWDSISHIHLILNVEREFDVKLTTSQIASLENVGGLIDALENSLA